ncbi:MAG: DUF4124 domain-containing protein [Candidatus Schekmanbacteria bacterium]|nr:MAG: DUF4124 domain-containing protein [Candidatus Schekmanbacteria bacterium]
MLRNVTIFLVALIFVLLPVGRSHSATIYKYTDENGVIHIVDSPEKIPPSLEEKVEKTKISSKPKEEEKDYKSVFDEEIEKSAEEAEAEKKKKEEEIKEWDEKKNKLLAELSEAEEKVKRAEAFRLRTVSSYSRKNYTNADRKMAQKQLEVAKENYEKVKQRWEEFKESARTDAPYEWWRENFF